MADIQRTIEILFRGVDGVSDTIRGISSGLENVGGSVQAATQPFADLTKYILAAEVAFAALIGVAIAGKSDIENLGNEFEATLGVTKDRAEEAAGVVKDIFSQGFGLEESTEAATRAFQQFADKSVEELGRIAEGAVKITNTFEADLPKTIDATKVLMENLGLTSDEALGFITKGFQEGLDRSGDFLDAITEYGNIFESAGFSAEEFYSILETGGAGGILGVDKIADAVKEFQLKISEGTDGVVEAFDFFGLDYAKIVEQIEAGSLTSADAFGLVLGKVKELPINSLEAKAKVAELGTQFEDLANTIRNVDIGATKIDEFGNKIDSLDPKFDNIKQSVSALFNTILVSFADSDALDGLTETIKERVGNLVEIFPEAFKNVDFGGLNDALEDVLGKSEGLLSDFFGGVDLTTPEGLSSAIQQIVDALEGFQQVVSGVIDGFAPFISLLGDGLKFFNELSPEAKAAAGEFLAFATQVGLAAGAISAIGSGGSAAVAIFDAFKGSAGGALTAIQGMATALGPTGLVLGAAAAGIAIGTLINQIPGVSEAVQDAIGFLDRLFSGEDRGEIELKAKLDDEAFENAKRIAAERIAAINENAEIEISAIVDQAKEDIDDLGSSVSYLSDDEFKNIAIGFDADTYEAEKNIKALEDKLTELQEGKARLIEFQANGQDVTEELAIIESRIKEVTEKKNSIKVEVDEPSVTAAKQQFETLSVFLEDGTEISIEVAIDDDSKEKTRKELEEIVPADKQLEFQVQLDIATVQANADRFKAQMEALQASVEWEAKLDIAEVEANAEIVKSAFESITATIESTGDVLTGLFSLFSEDLGIEKWTLIKQQIQKENEIRERALKLQEELTEKQLEVMDAWLKSKEGDGDPIKIEVNADGLKPHLEAVLYELLEYLQEKIVLEGGDMLIPIASA